MHAPIVYAIQSNPIVAEEVMHMHKNFNGILCMHLEEEVPEWVYTFL